MHLNEVQMKTALILVFLLLGISCGLAPAPAGDERMGIEKAARTYLDAEVRNDHKAIYAMQAPSSEYMKHHSYETYLAEAQASRVAVTGYRILKVTNIRDNDDRKAYPNIERFAQVEVDLVLCSSDTGHYEEINCNFTFIKEGGKWFKG